MNSTGAPEARQPLETRLLKTVLATGDRPISVCPRSLSLVSAESVIILEGRNAAGKAGR